MLQTLKFLVRHPLNADGRAAALSRFLRWQLGTRLLPVPHVMPFVEDSVLVMERGMTGATGNWYCGLHEEREMGFLLHFLRQDDLFVDIGANIGSYSVLAAGAVGARTVCFEPSVETYNCLLRNLFVNRIQDRVQAHNLGLGAREEVLCFSTGQDTTNHVVTDQSVKNTVEIRVRRLDDVLNGAVPRIIKLDVEGWEAAVLEGMPDTLAAPSLAAIICETNDSADRYAGAGDNRVFKTMHAHGFKAYSYDPFRRVLTTGGTAHNTIFVRDADLVV